MAIYPLEFYRRAEEKWRRRSESLRDAVTGSPSKKEGDDTLVRWPWLLAIGQGLQSEYAVLKKQPLPKRLAALLKKLTKSPVTDGCHSRPATASCPVAAAAPLDHLDHSSGPRSSGAPR